MKKINGIVTEESTVQEEIDTLKAEKDVNNYLPSVVVKYFFNEVKADSFAKAKLYLTKKNQGVDIKNKLNIDAPLNLITVTDVIYSVEDNKAGVGVTFYTTTPDSQTTKNFSLIKENEVWKIDSF